MFSQLVFGVHLPVTITRFAVDGQIQHHNHLLHYFDEIVTSLHTDMDLNKHRSTCSHMYM